MSELQTAKVLSGNFDLKIARQDYFISKQDAVERISVHFYCLVQKLLKLQLNWLSGLRRRCYKLFQFNIASQED